jgi:hypothetical protein
MTRILRGLLPKNLLNSKIWMKTSLLLWKLNSKKKRGFLEREIRRKMTTKAINR